jgi:RNase P/RNase MRP subunit p29
LLCRRGGITFSVRAASFVAGWFTISRFDGSLVLMPLHRLLPLLLFGLLVAAVAPAHAQQQEPASEAEEAEAPVMRLELRDGSVLIGRVLRETATTLVFRTVGGTQATVEKERVTSRRQIEGRIEDGQLVRRDPNRTRLFIGPTARPLRSGEGYFADYQLVFPFVAVGIGDVVSLAGGVSLVPGPTQLLYVAPKVTVYNRSNRSAAVGAVAGTTTEGGGTVGIVFAQGTLGSSEAAVTLGGGFAFGGGELFTEAPILQIGGEYQLSNSFKLISENYIFATEGGTALLTGGVRFFGEQLAASLGLGTVPELLGEEGFPFVPILSFAYNFGP